MKISSEISSLRNGRLRDDARGGRDWLVGIDFGVTEGQGDWDG